mmetsp:Transcript_17035/g.22940  ORF Transcript_17035/g.22940 Transcript_17035/m.22940 type:complete len:120 (-) Transcript_17035:101-460(-)|eukprot:CAMPEP_0185590332 /NCGR_PEP_ID=MMETSP0434-20130131/60431_1 /TAXON_ID=626734 ORGANISM="Favella taraikaensis, Strain Fe Narragansett Bay" /NCGR_SAMPLE_ID=MMETSP0434 /ASSEMBLY_ACC=CAM_ASM_000379 /LENGTH=119 /DNA_ID=CAMNT_0028214443 /DNA_START=1104 /DNA_END=1463 /DNA_ORIENTATION=-
MFARQRSTVDFCHRFVISEKDAEQKSRRKAVSRRSKLWSVDSILEGFDPANNEWDRRLLYEVTGIELNENEFDDCDSDCSDEAPILPINFEGATVDDEEVFEQLVEESGGGDAISDAVG